MNDDGERQRVLKRGEWRRRMAVCSDDLLQFVLCGSGFHDVEPITDAKYHAFTRSDADARSA